MMIDPDIPEAHKLKGWYDSDGRTGSYMSHSNMAGVGAASGRPDTTVTIAQVRDDSLGNNENPDYFSVKGTIIYIRNENFAYAACLNEGCNKKVTDMGDGTWRCEKCNVNHPRPQYRYILSLNVSDHTGQLWLSCFDDVGRIVMGMSADQLMELRENDEAAKERAFEAAGCKTLNFRCRAKMETFQDQQKYVSL
jgi:replication factor A1